MAQPLIQKNIVVIAETAAGKGSFFNNVALILRYANFEEAIDGVRDFVPLIPVNTRWNNTLIVDGQDENERSDQASSKTLKHQIYRIRYGNVVFNFIDTPGMSESGGQKMGKEQVNHMITCFGQLKDIHSILVLMKSTENTVNDSLKYTLNMVLSCLGKTAGKMISFGITYSGYNKNAGTAPDVIRKFFQDLRNNPEINYSNDNLFCFESERLFHVLSTKKGLATNAKDRQVNICAYEKNVKELHRLFTKVVNRNDSYNASNIQTIIFARHIHPALACLVGSKDQEYKYEVDLIEKEILTKDAALHEQRSNLMKVRRWKEPYEVERTRYFEETQNVTKERIVEEEYEKEEEVVEEEFIPGSTIEDIGNAAARGVTAGGAVGAFAGPLGSTIGGIFGGILGTFDAYQPEMTIYHYVPRVVLRTRYIVEQYVEKVTIRVPETYYVTKYRDREAYEEDLGVKQSTTTIEEERNQLKNELSAKSRLYESFQVEKEMILRLLSDLTLYLDEQSLDLSFRIEELKRKGLWTSSDSSPLLQDPMTRLRAMEKYKHFGKEIKEILSKCKEFENVQYSMVDIPIEETNPFMKSVLEGNGH